MRIEGSIVHRSSFRVGLSQDPQLCLSWIIRCPIDWPRSRDKVWLWKIHWKFSVNVNHRAPDIELLIWHSATMLVSNSEVNTTRQPRDFWHPFGSMHWTWTCNNHYGWYGTETILFYYHQVSRLRILPSSQTSCKSASCFDNSHLIIQLLFI